MMTKVLLKIGLILSICLAANELIFAQKKKAISPKSTASQQQNPLSEKAKAALDSAIASLEANNLPQAETFARQAVTASPRAAVARNVLGVILDKAGKAKEAAAEFQTAIQIDSKFISPRNNLARLLATGGKRTEAIAQFEQILKVDPNYVQARYNLGMLYAQEGKFEKAYENILFVRQKDPNDPQIAYAFLNIAYKANKPDEGNVAADQLEKLSGNDINNLNAIGIILAENKQYERVIRIYTKLNNLKPDTFEVLYNLGIAYYNLDKNDEAGIFLAKAADLNPAPPETHFRLALVASAKSDHANAAEEFKHAIERDGKNANYHYLLAREYFRAGFYEGSIQSYTKAMELNPNEVAYVFGRANANYRKGEWLASAQDFDRSAELDPTIKDIDFLRGYTHRSAGNFDRARELLEKFLVKNPDHVDALASLGYVAIEQGRFQEAEIPLKKALSLDPENVNVLYDFARISVKERNYDEGIKRLEVVIEKNKLHTQAYYQLFLVYSRLKQNDKAQAMLKEFKRLDELEKKSTEERILDEKLRTQRILGN